MSCGNNYQVIKEVKVTIKMKKFEKIKIVLKWHENKMENFQCHVEV